MLSAPLPDYPTLRSKRLRAFLKKYGAHADDDHGNDD